MDKKTCLEVKSYFSKLCLKLGILVFSYGHTTWWGRERQWEMCSMREKCQVYTGVEVVVLGDRVH